ncbi:MAG: hypothetical protein LBC77_01505 [Spirochaetaceae bacterium]|jgi:hypothetical protein|nr:hypothetical protein [Spirochaetaceae bacterium]
MEFGRYILVDYENVQDFCGDFINEATKLIILRGEHQKKLPAELIEKTQPWGASVEWHAVPGKGKNALDFFIAYFLGYFAASAQNERERNYIIYSKDTGYDPLIRYLNSQGMKVRRIVSFKELSKNKESIIDKNQTEELDKVRENLRKVPANRKPKTKKSLRGYIKNLLPAKNDGEIDKLVDDMFIVKMVYEENGHVKYAL